MNFVRHSGLSTILIFLVSFVKIHGQESQSNLEGIRQEVNREMKVLQSQLQSLDEFESEGIKQVFIEFAIDTARIESFLSKRLDADYTDYGMIQAINDAYADYDKLLNKYYQKLTKKLSAGDKNTLKDAQSAWIKFRDNEIKLAQTLAKEEYSGGGTIQNLNLASLNMQITKQRVAQIYEHFVGLINE
ncbi:MAG: lysozyme inhibitor LprI family protein [Chloroflexota bacterium]